MADVDVRLALQLHEEARMYLKSAQYEECLDALVDAEKMARLACKKDKNARLILSLILSTKGEVLKQLGEISTSIQVFLEAFDQINSLNHNMSENNLGLVSTQIFSQLCYLYRRIGCYDDAIRWGNLAIETYMRIGGSLEKISFLKMHLGDSYREMGECLRAKKELEESLDLAKRLGNLYGQAIAVNYLGETFLTWKKYPEALDWFKKAQRMFRELGRNFEEATAFRNTAHVFEFLGKRSEAIRALRAASKIYEKVGDKKRQARVMNDIGVTIFFMDKYALSVKYYEKTLKLLEETSDKEEQAKVLTSLGSALTYLGKFEEAVIRLKDAVGIYDHIVDLEGQVGALVCLSQAYGFLGKHQLALECGKKALAIALHVNNEKIRADATLSIAFMEYRLGRYEEALEHQRKGLEIYKRIEDRRGQADALIGLSLTNDCLGNYRNALRCSTEALTIYEEAGDRAAQANALDQIGSAYMNLGHNLKAIKYFEQALKIHSEIDNPWGKAEVLNGLGLVNRNLGYWQKALQQFSEAYDLSEKTGCLIEQTTVLNNIGEIYLLSGEYGKALEYCQKALIISTKIEDLQGKAIALASLASANFELGDNQEALKRFGQALDVFTEIGDVKRQAMAEASIAELHHNAGRYEEALEHQRKGLEIYKRIEDRRGQATAISCIANLEDLLGKNKEGMRHFKEALRMLKEIGDRRVQATTLCNMGSALSAPIIQKGYDERMIRQYKKAKECLVQSVQISHEIGCPAIEEKSTEVLGNLERAKSDNKAAFQWYSRSIDLLEKMRGSLVEERYKRLFSRRCPSLYPEMVSVCLEIGDVDQGFRYSEGARSKSLTYLLSKIKLKPSVRGESELNRLLQREKRYLTALRIALVPQKRGDLLSYSEQGLTKTLERLDSLYTQMQPHDPDYVSLRKGTILSTYEALDLVSSQQEPVTIIEYLYTQKELIIFLVKTGVDHIISPPPISLDGERLENVVQKCFQEIAHYPLLLEEGRAWQEISRILIEPLAGYLRKDDIVYFIPYGLLHYLPLHALLLNGEYLIRNHAVAYCPSLSVLRLCQAKDLHLKPKEKCLVVGVDFEDEAREIAQLLRLRFSETSKGDVIELIGPTISKKDVLRVCSNADIIHLSCHGKFDLQDPLNSGVALVDFLTAREIFDLRLQASLVTLSACETAISQWNPGDEHLGLARALLYAGAPSVVLSLWAVEAKSTRELMQRFYHHMFTPMSKAEALQRAQMDIMEIEGWEHPYYWAPFKLIGDWR
jgi:CHAT domain-containing protein/tetratricopeptide (TPR) repeat protein